MAADCGPPRRWALDPALLPGALREGTARQEQHARGVTAARVDASTSGPVSDQRVRPGRAPLSRRLAVEATEGWPNISPSPIEPGALVEEARRARADHVGSALWPPLEERLVAAAVKNLSLFDSRAAQLARQPAEGCRAPARNSASHAFDSEGSPSQPASAAAACLTVARSEDSVCSHRRDAEDRGRSIGHGEASHLLWVGIHLLPESRQELEWRSNR